MRNWAWVWIVLLLFGAVYAASLTFVYVEGDDADSAAYHAMGRDRQLHPPYAPYHGMLDLVLGILPASEPVIRTASIALTSAAAACMVLLMLGLAFQWLGDLTADQKLIGALGVLLAAPELSYLGLVYLPSVIAMSFVLGAHLLLKQAIGSEGVPITNRDRILFGASALLFAFGAACRWDTVLYGGVIFVDTLLVGGCPRRKTMHPFLKRLAGCVLWGANALILWMAAVTVTGYGIYDLARMAFYSGELSSGRTAVTASTISGLLSLFTPAFVLLCGWGWVTLARTRSALAVVSVFALLPAIPWLTTGSPKQIIFAIPSLAACAAAGMIALWELNSPGRAVIRAALAALLFGPWIIGVRATVGDTAWGPGFEQRAYDREAASGLQFSLGFLEGAAIPTQEGPRSLFGHAGTLLGGGWRRVTGQIAAERRAALRYAIDLSLPFIVLQGSDGSASAELVGMGFTTRDPRFGPDAESLLHLRRFSDSRGRTLRLLKSNVPLDGLLQNADNIAKVARLGGRDQIVVFGFYSRNTRTLYTTAPESLTRLGPNSLVLDLPRLQSRLGNQ